MIIEASSEVEYNFACLMIIDVDMDVSVSYSA